MQKALKDDKNGINQMFDALEEIRLILNAWNNDAKQTTIKNSSQAMQTHML